VIAVLQKLMEKVFFAFPKNKNILNQWIENLQIENDISKWKKVCSRHFEKKYIYNSEQQKNKKLREKMLSNKAVPTLYLLINSTEKLSNSSEVEILKSAIEKDHSCTSTKTNIPGIESANENFESFSDNTLDNPERLQEVLASTSTQTETKTNSMEIQTETKTNRSVETQTNSQFIYITSTWDTNQKLFTKTGIPSFKILDAMVKTCDMLKFNTSSISTRDLILLTMHKLKSNSSFAEIAIDFIISRQSCKKYF